MYLASHFIPQLTKDAHDKTKYLDGLRGVAASLVALNHAPLVIINLLHVPQSFYFPLKEAAIFGFLGSVGVQIFFCITGVLFAKKILFSSEIDWTSFFKKRLLRVVPAYVVASLLALVIVKFYTHHFRIMDVIRGAPNIFAFGLMQLPNINEFNLNRLLGVNWSLAYEWRYYVTLPIIFVMIRNLNMIAVVVGIIVFAVADMILTDNSFWVYFVSGAICTPLMHGNFSKKINYMGCTLGLAVLLIYLLYWDIFPAYGLVRWGLMTLLFFSIVVSRPYLLSTKPFVAMGSVSYSFYLLHVMIIFAVFEICHRYLIDVTLLPFWSFIILACTALAAAVFVSTISYLKIERPFMQFSN
jgi:peptidoglycan/LPS O-acetylase OafA/YrhL